MNQDAPVVRNHRETDKQQDVGENHLFKMVQDESHAIPQYFRGRLRITRVNARESRPRRRLSFTVWSNVIGQNWAVHSYAGF